MDKNLKLVKLVGESRDIVHYKLSFRLFKDIIDMFGDGGDGKEIIVGDKHYPTLTPEVIMDIGKVMQE